METINVLWTGGLDSTCRIIQLSVKEIIIQPFYIVDKSRKSIKNEIDAMEKIRHYVINNKNTKAIFKEIKYIENVSQNVSISKAYKNLFEKYNIGSQYCFIASFAEQSNLIFEVSLEKSNKFVSGIDKVIDKEGDLEEETTRSGIHRYLFSRDSSDDVYKIFGNIALPYKIRHMTKQEEIEEIKNLGYSKVVDFTWFCHNPIFGHPCGHCNPCRDVIEEGLGYRISTKGKILSLFRLSTLKTIIKRKLK